VNKDDDRIPLRENFEGSFDDEWTSTSPSDGMTWQAIELDGNKALYVDAYSNSIIGEESWLVSPVLDFTDIDEASFTFDMSYAYREGTSDILRILASSDCGNNFTDTLYIGSGVSLSNGTNSNNSWEPSGEADWTNMSFTFPGLAGEPNVRLAFVFENDQGNNLYIDNIEFYTSDTPVKYSEVLSVYPNPALNGEATITFNLPEKATVVLDIIDPMGKILVSETLTDILNQTFPLSLSYRSSGVYLVRIVADDKVYFSKLIVMK
jgi:hypothetical protein